MKIKEAQKAYAKRAKDKINKRHPEYYKEQKVNNTEFMQNESNI